MTDAIDQDEKCPECGDFPKLVEESVSTPPSNKKWDRYKCGCGHTTVRVPS